MLGGNDAVLDRLVAMLEAEDEEHAAAAERQDSDVAMQLYEADLVDAGLRPNVSTSTMLADMQQRLEAAEASKLAEQAAWHARKKRLEDQNANRHALRQRKRVSVNNNISIFAVRDARRGFSVPSCADTCLQPTAAALTAC